ncbi:MAG TPA: recombinase A [Kofleriaceae bacterium]|jgi:recombination protein RecA|nr:recombinase A [Kofleriaceae bacterium]
MSDDLFSKAKGVAAAARGNWMQKGQRLQLQPHKGLPTSRQPIELAGAPGEEGGAAPASEGPWGLDALRGRLVELSARGAAATLTAAVELVIEAQQAAEPVAWVTLGNATFFPPDAAASGVDLAALAVVRVHDATAAVRAAERLLRSGGFGLVVIDFGGESFAHQGVEVPIAHQGRLITLAQAHDAAVVCITEKPGEAPSLGSLVSLRAEAVRLHAPEDKSGGERGYHVTLRAIKDKRRGPGWTRTTKLRGPPGT